MKKTIKLLVLLLAVQISLCACDSLGGSEGNGDNVGEDIANAVVSALKGEDEEHIIAVKNGYPLDYPEITYGEAFDRFFGDPAWTYFVGTAEGTDEDGDGEPDSVQEDIDVVEFTGRCTYQKVEVTALIQFVLDMDDGSFKAHYLSFNDVPQSMFMLTALLDKAFEEAAESLESVEPSLGSGKKLQEASDIAANSEREVFETKFYTITLPANWNQLCRYDQWKENDDGYSIEFCEKQSYADNYGGMLFSIRLIPVGEDYDFPQYYRLGVLSTSGFTDYNVVVQYPSDVQFSDRGREQYIKLQDEIDGILASFAPKAGSGCTFTDADNLPAEYWEDSYLFPTDSVYITNEDLAMFNQQQIVLLRNEIYARYGYTFANADIRAYFESQSWYTPIPSINASTFDESILNAYERKNLDTIVLYEQSQGWR